VSAPDQDTGSCRVPKLLRRASGYPPKIHGVAGSALFLRGRPRSRADGVLVLPFPPARRDTRARMLSRVMRRARPSWYVDSSPSRMSWYNRVLPTPSRRQACRGETDKGSRSLSPLRPVTPECLNGMCSLYLRARLRAFAVRWGVRCPSEQVDVDLGGPSHVRPLLVGRSYVRPTPFHSLADGA
jgi:hypothetical protein